MKVIERNYSGISQIDVESWLLNERRCILIEGEINSACAESFKKQLLYLISINSRDRIVVQINSPGGNVDAGLLIYDLIHTCPVPIYTICTQKAFSMATVILACSHKGKRFILPNSQTMLHEVLTNNGVGGSCSSVKAVSDMLIATKEKIDLMLSEHTGNSLDKIKSLTSEEHYFSAKESVAIGICDEIIDLSQLNEIMKSRV